ncbi:DUF397 domain-containing protein [Actinophytocola sp. NPDC049390]
MTWHKSTRSEDGNCVEVRGDLQALRDSKSPIAVLPVSRGALRSLLTHVR